MVALHPHQQMYFNALTDTKTPGALAKRYEIGYWNLARLQSLEYLLARYPDDDLRVYPRGRSALILPQNDRERILFSNSPYTADYYINSSSKYQYVNEGIEEPAIHSVRAYGNGIEFILDTRSDAYRDYYRAAYDDVEANGTLLTRSGFDIYIHDSALHYLKENCESLLANSNFNVKVYLHFFPVDPADLSADRGALGFENRDVWIADPGAFFNGKCVHIQTRFPDYSIARIRTGQVAEGESLWSADIDLAAHAAARALYGDIAAGDYGQPLARSDFDVYLRGNTLAYLKDPCADGDADARFFLHIIPADPADLPAVWREYGFENLDFHFSDHGARAGDKCVAEREMPGYAIERIRTGQFVSGEGRVWSAEFVVGR